jgi:hypothetical protein
MEYLSLLDCAFELDRAWVVHLLQTGDFVVTDTVDVDSLMLIEVGASHVAVERDQVGVLIIHVFYNVKLIGDQV